MSPKRHFNYAFSTESFRLSRSTSFAFDALNRRIKQTFADNTTELTAYDALDRRVAVTNQAGVVTRFGYDALGRLVAVTNAFGTTEQMVTRFTYDELGNLLEQIDALNRTNRFEYDALGRRVKETLPQGQSQGFAYDAVGNLTLHTNFLGVVLTNQYDALNRLTNRSASGGYQVQMAYSPTGQRTNLVDASGTTRYTYDSRDRLKSKTSGEGTLNYTYNDFGNLATIASTTSGGVSLNYAYDALNRLTNAAGTPDAGSASYAFDAVGNLEVLRYANTVTNRYRYDNLNRLTNILTGTPSASLASYAYRLAPAGNRTNLIETVNGTPRTNSWRYDALYRLTNETINASSGGSVSYRYDAVGNRTNRTSTLGGITNQTPAYTANDWLTTDVYDSNGNTRTNGANVFLYDAENRLTNAVVGGTTIAMTYNADGVRVRKTISGTTTLYLVDDRNPTGYAQVLEEKTVSGGVTNLSKVFTYGLDLIAQRNVTAGETLYLSADGLGSTRLLTTTNATVANAFAYEAFGTLIASNAAPQTDYLFTGEQYDPNLGFTYLRARYHNPGTGRFLTRDTYAGNTADPLSLHRYTYVQNNPVNFVDPSGRVKISPHILRFLTKFGGTDLGIRILVGIRVTSVLGQAYLKEVNDNEGSIFIDRWIATQDDVPEGNWITDFRQRPDIMDFDNNTIYEIKPDNVASIALGNWQIAKYVEALRLVFPAHSFRGGDWQPQQPQYEVVGLPGISDLGFAITVSAQNVGNGVIAYQVHPPPELIALAVSLPYRVAAKNLAEKSRLQVQYATASLIGVLGVAF